MQITEVEIRLFRSLYGVQFPVGPATVICGPNSSGKSNILRALKFAFARTFDQARMAMNLSQQATSGNAAAKVKITFDRPTQRLATALGIPTGQPFSYQAQVKRNGKAEFYVNGTRIPPERRDALLDEVIIIDIPAVRDLETGGLGPFAKELAASVRRARGAGSFNSLVPLLKAAIRRGGDAFLAGAQATARTLVQVDRIELDADSIDPIVLLESAGIKYAVDNKKAPLDKLGTGHQSSVVLSLYRQLGAVTGKFVLYLFEEPDNHLHPTSLRAIAEDIKGCCASNSQALVTTHSPYLINQFQVEDWLPITLNADRLTTLRQRNILRGDKELRLAFGKYGLRPAEAMLATKVVVVEGVLDVVLVRKLIELHTGESADRRDILVLPAGGKAPLSDLCLLLMELGANWFGVYDWDATDDTSHPIYRTGLSAQDIATQLAAIQAITPELLPLTGNRKSKTQKVLDAMLSELLQQPAPAPTLRFENSVLGKHLITANTMTNADFAALKTAVRQRRTAAIRRLLAPQRLWLWSASPEDVIVNNSQAENVIEPILVQRGRIAAPFGQATPAQTAARAKGIRGIMHSLAHEPDLLEEILSALWHGGHLNRREVNQAIRHIVA